MPRLLLSTTIYRFLLRQMLLLEQLLRLKRKPVAFFRDLYLRCIIQRLSEMRVRSLKPYESGVTFSSADIFIQLVTDQQSVRFMFDQKNRRRIKIEKILRWRLEIAHLATALTFPIVLDLNLVADALSRVPSDVAAIVGVSNDELLHLQDSLCHPGGEKDCLLQSSSPRSFGRRAAWSGSCLSAAAGSERR